MLWTVAVFWVKLVVAADGNRLAYLDEFCDPYYVGLTTAKLVTPQWIGREGVSAAVILAIDDMGDPPHYERYLRPILTRLAQIDGRSPVSIMTKHVDPSEPLLKRWSKEGVSLESHTYDHPCPCLDKSDFEKAKGTYDRSVEAVNAATGGRTVAFRMPCCDSMNSASPRFYAEIFNRTTPAGKFLMMDSSVFLLFTASDRLLPRDLVTEQDGRPRFAKYIPADRKFVNFIQDYPYPYVIARLCWEMPTAIPDDWQGIHLQRPYNPITVRDMKAAIDAAAIKQGIYVLTFHPGAWIRAEQVIELIDHATKQHGRRIMFLNFREAYERLTENMLGGQPLRAANGQDNGVRVLDVNNDGYMDVVIGNEHVRQTRIWSPETNRWVVTGFPVEIVSPDAQGNRQDMGVRFGVLQKRGYASFLVANEKVAGLWHFDGRQWQADPAGLNIQSPGAQGTERIGSGAGALLTSHAGRDRGARLLDLDCDGICELLVSNHLQQAAFQWLPAGGWKKLPFTLPPGTAIVDAQGRDAGCRLVDIDEDGRRDVIFSNAERYSLHLFVSLAQGWSRKIMASARVQGNAIPMIVRADGTNNGAWFKYGHMWVQNEDTGEDVVFGAHKLRIPIDSRPYAALLQGVAAGKPKQ